MEVRDILPPTPPTPSEVDAITEFRNGTVEITFTPLRDNLRRIRSMSRSEFSSARQSFDRRSFSIPRGLVMQGLCPDHTTPTPEFETEETQYTSAQTHQSPTRSDFSQLNVISSFEINKKLLQAIYLPSDWTLVSTGIRATSAALSPVVSGNSRYRGRLVILYIGWNTRGRRATGPKKGLLKERKFV